MQVGGDFFRLAQGFFRAFDVGFQNDVFLVVGHFCYFFGEAEDFGDGKFYEFMAKRCDSLAAGDVVVLVAKIFEDGAGDLRSDSASCRDDCGELCAFG